MGKKSEAVVAATKYKIGDRFRYVNGGYQVIYEVKEVLGANGLPGEPLYQLEAIGRQRLGTQLWVSWTASQIERLCTAINSGAPTAPEAEIEPVPVLSKD